MGSFILNIRFGRVSVIIIKLYKTHSYTGFENILYIGAYPINVDPVRTLHDHKNLANGCFSLSPHRRTYDRSRVKDRDFSFRR